MDQERVTTTNNGRIHIAYAVSDVLEYLGEDLTPFTKIRYKATDDFENSVGNQYERTNFDNVYIALGFLNADDTLNETGAPRILIDGAASAGGTGVIQNGARITVNPLAGLSNDYAVPAIDNIEVYDGNTLKATITVKDLEAIQQKFVRVMTGGSSPTDRTYVAYAVSDVLAHLGVEIPTFTSVVYAAPDGFSGNSPYERTSFARAYIAIGFWNTGAANPTLNMSGAPRLIADSNTEVGRDVINGVARITVNPE
jgi:hypothetical protein